MYNKIYSKFHQAKIKKNDFLIFANSLLRIEDKNTLLEVLKGCGLWIKEEEDSFILETINKNLQESIFCFVDIETTGSKPINSRIIEIGAIKYYQGKIVEKFETLVFSDSIPESIVKLTGIEVSMLKNAPQEKECLQNFKKFLGDSIFVAHNVAFDYNFISERLKSYGNFPLLNPRLCTVELAKRSILSLRYSLGYLNQFLGLKINQQHRAYSDALACLKIFEIANLSLPREIEKVQQLIDFSHR